MDDNVICYFGETDARNKRVRFGIKSRDRSRHTYVIGKTGMGKSTMLENMAIQDMRHGDGMAFIDPHGKTAELLLEYVPEERIKDVLYFAPFDLEYPVSFNVMEDVGHDKRHLVVSGLMSAFKKIWVDAWSARMEYILSNILLALLEYPGSTILGVNRMLADKEYRNKVVANVQDVSVRSFWIDEFAKYGDRYMQEAGAAIQNKVGQFVSNPLIRNIIGQPKSTFDLRKMMDSRKIIIVNLSKGRVGEQNANLLGSMFITKLYLAAMSRADLSDSVIARVPNFYLYVDEFQSFANESFANILSEARKYKLALTIAHQYIEQMSEEVRAAVFGNVGTMAVFRVGAFDAEVLEKEFAPKFTAEDIVNLGIYQIYLKLMIDGVTSPPFSAATMAPLERPAVSYRDDIIENTRKVFALPRADVEEAIRMWSMSEKPPEAPRKPRPPESATRGDVRTPTPAPGASTQAHRPSFAGHASGGGSRPMASAPILHSERAQPASVARPEPTTPVATPLSEVRPTSPVFTRKPDHVAHHEHPAPIPLSALKPQPRPAIPHSQQAVHHERPTSTDQRPIEKKAGTEGAKSDLRSALASILQEAKAKESRVASPQPPTVTPAPAQRPVTPAPAMHQQAPRNNPPVVERPAPQKMPAPVSGPQKMNTSVASPSHQTETPKSPEDRPVVNEVPKNVLQDVLHVPRSPES